MAGYGECHNLANKLLYNTIFDLENQFFHVKLTLEVKDLFGFAIVDEEGKESYIRFNIMVSGSEYTQMEIDFWRTTHHDRDISPGW